MVANARGGTHGRRSDFSVVLVTHVAPPIHGQSVMASELVAESASWERVRLVAVNAVYSGSRDSLVSFGLRKALLALGYIGRALLAIRRTRAPLVIVTPSFHPGPFLKDALVIVALKSLTRAQVIAWVHMDPARLELESKPWWYRRAARYALARVDAWVACAPSLPGRWPSFVPSARTHVVNHGIRGVPGGLPTSPVGKATRVCFMSSLDSSKGWMLLLDVARELCASDCEVEFHFYGDVGLGSSPPDVAERFRDAGFPGRIVWHGPAVGIEKWRSLSSADLFCLPSLTEQLPLVILEAMACQLAIVATRVGGVEDAVVEGEGGWLVAPGSRDELARALVDALADRGRLERFGRYNAQRQRRAFSIERYSRDWERLLLTLAQAADAN